MRIDRRSQIFNLTLTTHFQDGGHDVISHSKVLSSGEWTRSVRHAPMEPRIYASSWSIYVYTVYLFIFCYIHIRHPFPSSGRPCDTAFSIFLLLISDNVVLALLYCLPLIIKLTRWRRSRDRWHFYARMLRSARLPTFTDRWSFRRRGNISNLI